MKINKQDVVLGGKIQLPKQVYRICIVNTEGGKSSSGNPMTTLKCEIIEPETLIIDGTDYRIAGKGFNLYLVHVPGLVGKQTQSSQSQVIEFCTKLGLNPYDEEGNYNTELHKEFFLGRIFDIVLSSEEDFKRYNKQPGEKVGQIMKDQEGNPLSNGYVIRANVSDVLEHCRPERRMDLPF